MLHENPFLVILAGLSGAGRSVAMKVLEDLSYLCIENIPPELVEHAVMYFLKLSKNKEKQRFALGIDFKSLDSVSFFNNIKDDLTSKIRTEILFLTCNDEVLCSRYTTTRRKHPLLEDGGDLFGVIEREVSLLSEIEKIANHRIDTSLTSPHQLSRILEERYAKEIKGRALHVTVTSFGFKYGILKTADSIFDVRFIKNPYFEPNLREKSGLHPEIQHFLDMDVNTMTFVKYLEDLHKYLLPNYYREGKHYFRIGIGCTGGVHRSVYIAEKLAQNIVELSIPNVSVSVAHRDLLMR